MISEGKSTRCVPFDFCYLLPGIYLNIFIKGVVENAVFQVVNNRFSSVSIGVFSDCLSAGRDLKQ